MRAMLRPEALTRQTRALLPPAFVAYRDYRHGSQRKQLALSAWSSSGASACISYLRVWSESGAMEFWAIIAENVIQKQPP
jgi:hypothetical protein